MPLSVDSENRIARWAMWVLSMTKGTAESLWDSGNPSNRWRIPTGMRFHGTHPREKYKRCRQKSTKTRAPHPNPLCSTTGLSAVWEGSWLRVPVTNGYKRLQTVSEAKLTAESVADDNKRFQNTKICRFRVPRSWRHSLSR